MLASGCSLIMPKTPAANPLRYYRYQGADLSRVGRVVMLELKNLSSNPQLGNDITVALAEEIQKKQVHFPNHFVQSSLLVKKCF